jgi:hypothetical protein
MKSASEKPGTFTGTLWARVDSAHKPAHGSSTCPRLISNQTPPPQVATTTLNPTTKTLQLLHLSLPILLAQCLRGDGDSHCNKEFDCNGLGQATCCKNTHQHLQPSHLTNTVYPDQHFWHIWLKKQFLQSIMSTLFPHASSVGFVCLIASMLSSKLWYPSSTPSAGFSRIVSFHVWHSLISSKPGCCTVM